MGGVPELNAQAHVTVASPRLVTVRIKLTDKYCIYTIKARSSNTGGYEARLYQMHDRLANITEANVLQILRALT